MVAQDQMTPHSRKRRLLAPLASLYIFALGSCGSFALPVDLDGDGVSLEGGDCDGDDPSTYPGAPELCDGRDNDCDGWGDVDLDGDGALACGPCEGGVVCGDCDDEDPNISPLHLEVCSDLKIDEDCDGLIDDDDPDVLGALTYYLDDDGDGYGSKEVAGSSCRLPPGTSPLSGDCDDGDPSVHPGAPETCEGVPRDSNCDGVVEDSGADYDEDGWSACSTDHSDSAPVDCDDADPLTNPGAEERCDGLDNDCNGLVDDPIADFDEDGDGTSDCVDEDQDKVTEAQGDCDDLNRHAYPGAPEYADEQDNDCDGLIDEALGEQDRDGDGISPAGGDCDDGDAAVYPGAPEICDVIDNDCDGQVDEGLTTLWYVDRDVDGFGVGAGISRCERPREGYASQGGDCDDSQSTINPDAAEICDGIDNNCDGLIDDWPDEPLTYYPDMDSDGYGDGAQPFQSGCSAPRGYVRVDGDCNDSDGEISPDHEEICGDRLDNDCDGLAEEGCSDSEGLCTRSGGTWTQGCTPRTCDDPCGSDCVTCVTEIPLCECPLETPIWDETEGCMAWNRCEDLIDNDGDGYPPGIDCDDRDPSISPVADEICRNGIDDDCDERLDETPCQGG